MSSPLPAQGHSGLGLFESQVPALDSPRGGPPDSRGCSPRGGGCWPSGPLSPCRGPAGLVRPICTSIPSLPGAQATGCLSGSGVLGVGRLIQMTGGKEKKEGPREGPVRGGGAARVGRSMWPCCEQCPAGEQGPEVGDRQAEPDRCQAKGAGSGKDPSGSQVN